MKKIVFAGIISTLIAVSCFTGCSGSAQSGTDGTYGMGFTVNIAEPQGEPVHTGSCSEDGTSITWSLYEDGTVVVEGVGAMKEYDYETPRKHSPLHENSLVKKVLFKDGITEITNMFYGCPCLESVQLPSTVTKLYFCGLPALKEIALPEGINEVKLINCEALESVVIPSTATRFSFSRCTALKHVELPSTLTSMPDEAFIDCTSLTSIELPEGMQDFGYKSFARSGVTEITIPESVKDICGFGDCHELKKVVIKSKGDFEILNDAFSGCDKLEEVVLPEGLKSIGDNAFRGCNSLKEIVLPEGLESIGSDAFSNCENLKTITLPASAKDVARTAFSGSPCENSVYQNGKLVDYTY